MAAALASAEAPETQAGGRPIAEEAKYAGFKSAAEVVEDGYEFFAKRQLVTLFSAPNYCGEFDNAGAMMSVDETLMCSFQILKVSRVRREEGGRRHAKNRLRVLE